MHINIDICQLYEYYFDEIAVGSGDLLVFKSPLCLNAYFIADLYRELTDQLDNVTFYIYSPDARLAAQIKPYVRRFFDRARYQFAYMENCASTLVEKITAGKSGDIYEIVEESGYKQKIIFKN
ncbi:hypothetical protein VSX61_13020 [Brenneria populi subsp. brevivirga]|uniref:hypothetical protein n=1 Tax=Brenneria populi TaxID=1505588 RepID=UPI002E17C3C9|nr:hypothetical protein [Brenneria populi subsp. brevivirga]